MSRSEIQAAVFGDVPDRLWVPLLTHYDDTVRPMKMDVRRTEAHVRAIRPFVHQFMLAGSTGDGWELNDEQYGELLAFAGETDVFDDGCRVLIAALRPTTDQVIAFANSAEEALPDMGQPGSRFAGLAVCPPIDEHAGQQTIIDHYDQVLAHTHSPLAVYQLPQVTQCTIQPETLQELARKYDRIVMFKDSSGQDLIAKAGIDLLGVILVRGAEGDYVEALKPVGPYDGWLLSTANVFAKQLRMLLEKTEEAGAGVTRNQSAELSEMVRRMFAEVGSLPSGNAFANANRAMDHLLACGAIWREMALPVLPNGIPMEADLIAAIERQIGQLMAIPQQGYLSQQGWTL